MKNIETIKISGKEVPMTLKQRGWFIGRRNVIESETGKKLTDVQLSAIFKETLLAVPNGRTGSTARRPAYDALAATFKAGSCEGIVFESQEGNKVYCTDNGKPVQTVIFFKSRKESRRSKKS